MEINQFLQYTNIDELANAIAPKRKTKTAYMCLDTLYARFLENNTKVQWDFMSTLTEGPNSTNVESKVRDITSVRMLSMVIPQFPSVAHRASIAIDEFKTQAFILPNGRRFHFIELLNNLETGGVPLATRSQKIGGGVVYDFTIMNKYELLAGYKFNEGYYRFNKPIVSIDTVTVSIADPFDAVILPRYQYINIPISFNSGTLTLTFPEYVLLPGAIPAELGTPALDPAVKYCTSIFISNFTTDQPVADAVWISTINQYEFTNVTNIITQNTSNIITLQTNKSYHAGVALGGTDVSVRVYLPTNGLLPPVGNPSLVTVQFNSNRIIMNFEIEYNV